ncbi:MAG: signal recognition particle protein [Actinomycetota bacterium]
MFDALTKRIDGVFRKLRGRGKLHPKQVDAAVDDLRAALLEADVAVEVADDLLARVRERALSEEVMKSLTPAQQVVKVVRDELTTTLGGEHVAFPVPSARPGVVMLAGVQGSGKTTTAAKLARRFASQGRSVLLVAADLWRPAAVEQLRALGEEIGVPVVSEGSDAVAVARHGLEDAKRRGVDLVIVDTAGRLHVDEEMMREAVKVRDAIAPHVVVMACDAMTGQDAIVQARAFREAVDVDGFVLTKVDGDARGGAAVSIAAATGRPVYFTGTGERPEALEPFHPDRMASRILGMGDVLGLIDRAQETIDADRAREQAERLATARFTLEDFLEQLRQMRRLGPIQDVLAMLPGAAAAGVQVDEGRLVKAEAVICSMTPEERRNPAIIGGSRRARIAKGSGTTTADVNALLREFDQARKMMKSVLGGGGPMGRMPKGFGRNLPGRPG